MTTWNGQNTCHTQMIILLERHENINNKAHMELLQMSTEKQTSHKIKLHFDITSFPKHFISLDLIREFHPPSKKGHRNALTIICMLTGYVFCIPLKMKTASEVI